MWANFCQFNDKENLPLKKEPTLDLGLEMTLHKMSWGYKWIAFFFNTFYALSPLMIFFQHVFLSILLFIPTLPVKINLRKKLWKRYTMEDKSFQEIIRRSCLFSFGFFSFVCLFSFGVKKDNTDYFSV